MKIKINCPKCRNYKEATVGYGWYVSARRKCTDCAAKETKDKKKEKNSLHKEKIAKHFEFIGFADDI